MTKSTCENCGNSFHWCWEDAFDKFGFSDGDGQIETWKVADKLRDAGYDVHEIDWSIHNTIISSIKKDGIELIPEEARIGYADPRTYLPRKIVALLDEAFPPTVDYYNAGAEA